MAVYRPRPASHRRPWLWAGLTVLLAAAGLVVASVWRAGRQAGPASPLRALERMAATVDVLRLSHYTADTVQDGQVVQKAEYEAALEDVRQLRRDWELVRPRLPADRAADVERLLNLLETQVQQRRPAQEVAATADRLIQALYAVDGSRGP